MMIRVGGNMAHLMLARYGADDDEWSQRQATIDEI